MRLRRVGLCLATLLLVGGCGDGWGGGTSYYAVGWANYELPTCKGAQVASGTSLRKGGSGFHAVEPGTTKLRCGTDRARIVVKRADRLTITGPTTLQASSDARYRIVAFAGKRELDVGKESTVTWKASGASAVDPAYCNHPMFSCPGQETARIRAGAPGTMVVEVGFEGLVGTLTVTITPS